MPKLDLPKISTYYVICSITPNNPMTYSVFALICAINKQSLINNYLTRNTCTIHINHDTH